MPARRPESRSPHTGTQRHRVCGHDDKGVEATAHGTVSQPESHGEVACRARNVDPADPCSTCHAHCRHHKFDHSIRTDSNGNDDDHDCDDNDVVNVHHHDIFDNIFDDIFDNNFDNDDNYNVNDNDHDCGDNDDVGRGMADLWFESRLSVCIDGDV